MTHVLVLGATGQVATALRRRLEGEHRLTVAGRSVLDLSDPVAAYEFVRGSGADVVVNAAAYTAVDRAETEAEAARALNATGPEAAARAAAEIGAPFIHFSTDYVFDGSKGSPYVETDPVNPLGVYGATKLEGEAAVAAANPRHVILRTSWVCSPDGANFLKTMLRLAAEKDEIGVVSDQHGRPTFASDLAEATVRIIEALLGDEDAGRYGVFHASSRGETTWYGFATAIMEGSAARGGPSCRVRPIGSAEYPTPVRRPADSRLDGARLEQVYGVRMPEWREALDRCLDQIYDRDTRRGDAT
ncbi:dTDP-4-dehydrorhamnose reductase [Brevundimonas sp. NIBR11]|uniref:dTDP-4-dehydrorhamnose reductase n=1 Tax=Brevundimonas sp. NIBR11 TaxID=3015999 RepID=UPI0022EFF5B1|nr:dTDP-4-dehydrorhamnose reductase [Brevundimonas sp. NIBR11]WGM32281.1 dTDP-4-dehydrorhamnose reductase [Brevundimonas sp. NIBR11]